MKVLVYGARPLGSQPDSTKPGMKCPCWRAASAWQTCARMGNLWLYTLNFRRSQ